MSKLNPVKTVSPKAFAALLALLNRPAQTNEALRRTMQSKSPWAAPGPADDLKLSTLLLTDAEIDVIGQRDQTPTGHAGLE